MTLAIFNDLNFHDNFIGRNSQNKFIGIYIDVKQNFEQHIKFVNYKILTIFRF